MTDERRLKPHPRGRLRWSIVLDVATDPYVRHDQHLRDLLSRGRTGSTVIVRVGDTEPLPSLIDCLADALGAGVDVSLEGGPQTVGRWWWAIHRPGRAQLTVVE